MPLARIAFEPPAGPLRQGRRVIDDDRVLLQRRRDLIEEPVHRRIVLHHDMDVVGVGHRGRRRGRDPGAVGFQRARLGPGAVPHRDRRAALQKVADHPRSEQSGSEQRDWCHVSSFRIIRTGRRFDAVAQRYYSYW